MSASTDVYKRQLHLQAAGRDHDAGVRNCGPIRCDRSLCVNAGGLILTMYLCHAAQNERQQHTGNASTHWPSAKAEGFAKFYHLDESLFCNWFKLTHKRLRLRQPEWVNGILCLSSMPRICRYSHIVFPLN